MMNNYRCDICGCYLDPGEGRICDECRVSVERRNLLAKRMTDKYALSDGRQYEMKMEELVYEY